MSSKDLSSQGIEKMYRNLFPEAITSDQRKRQSGILSRHVVEVEVGVDKEDSVEESVRDIFEEWKKDPNDTYSVEEL